MDLQQRINAFVKLGEKIVENDYFKDHFQKILRSNPWFTKENIILTIVMLLSLNMLYCISKKFIQNKPNWIL